MRFLIDEMFPLAAAAALVKLGHDAMHVSDVGVDASPDREVAAAAAREARVLLTENVKDFSSERDIVIVCVLKAWLPAQGMAVKLAALVDRWAKNNPEPYVGVHWPQPR